MEISQQQNQLTQNRPRMAPSFQKTLNSFTHSYIFSMLVEFLGQRETIRLQEISRFFYNSQIPRCMATAQVSLRKVRLHLFNHDYVVIFNIYRGTKTKKKLKGEIPHLWNCQSLEVGGVIYITGGSLANTKTYLKSAYIIDESVWKMKQLADMNYQRDAHGVIEWRRGGGQVYLVVVGSWHVEANTKTCEMYDIQEDKWIVLPELNYATCAPGLIVIKDRYLYKLGGTTNIRKIEYLDMENADQWITINTSNQMGKKQSINRCLLHPLWGWNHKSSGEGDSDDQNSFLILGCHFGRTESPFIYNVEKNKFSRFQKNDMQIDMYRSNDVVQLRSDAIFIRPFVKVGDPPENIKVLKYYMKFRKEEDSEYQENGPIHTHNSQNNDKAPVAVNSNRVSAEAPPSQYQNVLNQNRQVNLGQKVGNLLKNIFSANPKISTKAFIAHRKGQVEEVEFATTEWDNE